MKKTLLILLFSLLFIPRVFAQVPDSPEKLSSYTISPSSELYFNSSSTSYYFADLEYIRSTSNFNIYKIVPTENSPIYYHYYYSYSLSSSPGYLTNGFGKFRNLGTPTFFNYDVLTETSFFYQYITASTTGFRFTNSSSEDVPSASSILYLSLSSSAYNPTLLFLYETPSCPETPSNPFTYETPIDKTSIFSYATSSIGLTSHFPFSLLLTIFIPLFFIILIITIIRRFIR